MKTTVAEVPKPNGAQAILDYALSQGLNVKFTYSAMRRALGLEHFHVTTFKKWTKEAAQLAHARGLCFIHPCEANGFTAMLTDSDSNAAVDSFIHVANTTNETNDRTEMYVKFMDANAPDFTDAKIAATAALSLFVVQEAVKKGFRDISHQIQGKRLLERRKGHEAEE